MLKVKNHKVGSDPELFLMHDNQIIPAIGAVGGTKVDPKPLREPGYFVQEDNVAVEFNIPPASNKKEWQSSILKGIELVKELLPPEQKLIARPSYIFTEDMLRHPQAQIFGCDPDYCAWTKEINKMPEASDNCLRVCGGHVLVGYDDPNQETNIELIKAMDLYLGVPSVLLDGDLARRTMYGKAGAFRHKSFGVEYRTLSSFWLASPEYIDWVYDGVQKAVEFVNSTTVLPINISTKIVKAINENNIGIAAVLVDKYNITIP
jgi:hypothetical protein